MMKNKKDNSRYTVIVRYHTVNDEMRSEIFDSADLKEGLSDDTDDLTAEACRIVSGYARTKEVVSAGIHPATENEILAFEAGKRKRDLNRKHEFFRNFNRTADTGKIRSDLEQTSVRFRQLQKKLDEMNAVISSSDPECSLKDTVDELIRYYATYAAVFPVSLIPNNRTKEE